MTDRNGTEGGLWEAALALNRRARPKKPLPPLLFVTDPARTPDPAAIAARLPQGAGVILRAFGAADALSSARRLREVCTAGGVKLLIGQDAALAQACGADGVHLPERDLARGPDLRRDHPGWLLTGAAHGPEALTAAAAAGLDAALLSPVFESRSPSATTHLGPERFSGLVRGAALPVYALGGIDARTAAVLIESGAVGLAAVEAVAAEYGAHEGDA